MDTTLRDGEQTSGMSFSASEKLTISKLLIEELNIDRIEVASARVSKGEFEAVKNITKWAKENNHLEKIEILTFLDNNISLEWIKESGAKVQNLLTKGSLNHLTYQIKKSPKEYFNLIDIPSFTNHLTLFQNNYDLIIDNSYYRKPTIKQNHYIKLWISKFFDESAAACNDC